MDIATLITLLSVLLAVFALISKEERQLLKLFFSRREQILLLVILIFIHFLLSFEWLKENWFPYLTYFECGKGIPSSAWAYFFTILFIIYPILKVNYGFFTRKKRRELISLYKSLIVKNEIPLLCKYIERYHLNFISFDNKNSNGKNNKKKDFAFLVFEEIIQKVDFIEKAALSNVNIFSQVFQKIPTENNGYQDFVQNFIRHHLYQKSELLTKELKTVDSQNTDYQMLSKLTEEQKKEVPILYSLLGRLEFANKFQIWQPFGDEGLRSLKIDANQNGFLESKFELDFKDECWNQKIYLSIKFINLMVRESINNDFSHHMWLYYYRTFIELLIEKKPTNSQYNSGLFSTYLIEYQFELMINWINLAHKKETETRIPETINCLEQIIELLITSQAIEDEFIQSRFIDLYEKLWLAGQTGKQENIENLIKEKAFEMLNRVYSKLEGDSRSRFCSILKSSFYWYEGNSDIDDNDVQEFNQRVINNCNGNQMD